MKTLFIFAGVMVVLFLVAPSEIEAQEKKPIANADVVEMVKAELSEQVIITSIRQATSKDFDLTPTGLISLKKAGVPSTVILAMQEANGRPMSVTAVGDKTTAEGAETPPHDPNAKVMEELLVIERVITAAHKRGDKAVISKFLADDFVLVLDGKSYNKVKFLETVKPRKDMIIPEVENTKLAFEGEKVTLSGTAVIRLENGSILKATFNDTFVKRDGWQIISAQASKYLVTTPPKAIDNGCSGIELMGVYKDSGIPSLVISFAKIRNGTALTRIVIVEFLDMYGQVKKLQAEIKPGEIATIRLSMNLPVERLPINVRLSSCR